MSGESDQRLSSAKAKDPATVPLACDNLTAGYGDVEIVSGFSLHCATSEIVALVGPNGCGKSTLLKRIAGLLSHSGGGLTISGHEASQLSAGQISDLGVQYVPQVGDVFPSLTVEENLFVGRTDATKIEEAISVFPLLKGLMKRKAGRLSGGERKSVAIARAFMHPRITLLMPDEPSAGLSPKATSVLWPVLTAAAQSELGVVIVEQRVDEVLEFADRAYVMVDGRNRLTGSASELRNSNVLGQIFVGL